ncbi:MAG: hypothetical protein RRY21_05730, partial [Oscillospiraceae bacterium]
MPRWSPRSNKPRAFRQPIAPPDAVFYGNGVRRRFIVPAIAENLRFRYNKAVTRICDKESRAMMKKSLLLGLALIPFFLGGVMHLLILNDWLLVYKFLGI